VVSFCGVVFFWDTAAWGRGDLFSFFFLPNNGIKLLLFHLNFVIT
jgi:hypothetical protein